VTRPPDFDQLLSVDVTGHRFTDAQLLAGIEVALEDRPNQPAARLKEGEQVAAVATIDGTPVDVSLAVGVELYFETNDLESAM